MSVISADLPRFASSGWTSARRTRTRQAAGGAFAVGVIAAGDLAAFVIALSLSSPPPAIAATYGLLLALVLVATGRYRPRINLAALAETPAHLAWSAITLLALGLLEALPLALWDGDAATSSVVLLAGAAAVLVPLGRWGSYSAVRALRRRRIVRDPVLIVGVDEVGRSLATTLEEHAEHGLQPIGFVDDVDPADAPAPLLGDLSALDQVVAEQSVRTIIVAFGAHRDRELVDVVRDALHSGIEIYLVPRIHQLAIDAGSCQPVAIDCTPLHRLQPAAPQRRTWRAKRAFDLLVAGAALLVLSPLLAALAIAVRSTSSGPILFRQVRLGQGGRPFQLLKFRSMRVNDDSDVCWTVAGDDRQTRVGRLMRRTSLDELPQLWNVVRGDMSLVGPRPERPHFAREFTDSVPDYDARAPPARRLDRLGAGQRPPW